MYDLFTASSFLFRWRVVQKVGDNRYSFNFSFHTVKTEPVIQNIQNTARSEKVLRKSCGSAGNAATGVLNISILDKSGGHRVPEKICNYATTHSGLLDTPGFFLLGSCSCSGGFQLA